jgi:mannose-6-phosphate isomerase-like protein (cupin superfamily)
MTGLYDRKPGDKPGLEGEHGHPIPDHHHPHDHDHPHDHAHPHDHSHVGPGHNIEHDVVWERWEKRRTFVRALEGTYGELTQSLLEQPRVYSSRNLPWKGGPQLYGKHVISPQAATITQSIETHIEVYAPGAYGQKHGHLNSAVFYILKGRGHDIHDERRIDWKAGDAMIVENGCVHQHFNDDPDNEAILLVFKAKPLFLFMHLLYQKIVSFPPKTAPEGHEDWKPPTDL